MAEHPADALTRFDYARQQLAQADAAVMSYGLQAHVNGARLSDADLDSVQGLLGDLADAGATFCAAARDLTAAISEAESAA